MRITVEVEEHLMGGFYVIVRLAGEDLEPSHGTGSRAEAEAVAARIREALDA